MLKVNVGLCRKFGEPGYGSRGGAVHLEAELDSGLAAQPEKLQERLRHLFGLARAALAAELQPPVPAETSHASTAVTTVPSVPGHSGRKATTAQVRAITHLADRKAVGAEGLARLRYGVTRPEDLTVPQAADLIDELRSLDEPSLASTTARSH